MAGRDTPSLGLERAARYVAGELVRTGLKPADTTAELAGLLQRYPVPGHRRMDYAASKIVLMTTLRTGAREIVGEDGEPVGRYDSVHFMTGARPAQFRFRWDYPKFAGFTPLPQSTAVVAGPHDAASIRRANIQAPVVVYVPPAAADSAARRRVIDELERLGGGLLILADEDSASFARQRDAARRQPVQLVDRYLGYLEESQGWSVYLWPDAVREWLAVAGIELGRLRVEDTPVVQLAPAIKGVYLRPTDDTLGRAVLKAPNVIGVLPGADAELKKQYLVVATHIDQAPAGPGQTGGPTAADDDNTAGVAGLLALARALQASGARPRRSVIFLATSGGTKDGRWGSAFFARWAAQWPHYLPIVGAIAVDLRGDSDTITIDGLEDITLTTRPDWLAAQHPELGLAVRGGGSVVTSVAEHSAFVRRAIPSLFVHAGSKDVEHTARVFRFIAHLIDDIANTDAAPRWTNIGRQHLGKVLTP